jgi:hypothetical protein
VVCAGGAAGTACLLGGALLLAAAGGVFAQPTPQPNESTTVRGTTVSTHRSPPTERAAPAVRDARRRSRIVSTGALR